MSKAISQKPAMGRNETSISSGEFGLVFTKHYNLGADSQRRLEGTLLWDAYARENGWSFTPAIVAVDRENHTVGFEYVDSARGLDESIRANDPAVVDQMREAGRLLRHVHAAAILGQHLSTEPPRVSTAESVSFSILALPKEAFARSSGGELECWRMLQSDPPMARELREWTNALFLDQHVLAHGDLRPDQFLVDEAGELQLVDGEELTVASPVADLAGMVGSVMFSYLLLALNDLQDADSNTSPMRNHDAFLDAADRRLIESVAPVSAFINGYGTDALSAGRKRLLAQGVGWAMLERVLARSMMSYRMAGADRVIAGIARQALLSPESLSFVIDGMD